MKACHLFNVFNWFTLSSLMPLNEGIKAQSQCGELHILDVVDKVFTTVSTQLCKTPHVKTVHDDFAAYGFEFITDHS